MGQSNGGNGARYFTRRHFLKLSGGLLAGMALSGALASPDAKRASAADRQEVVVDLATGIGPPTYLATGFLHGLSQDASLPPDSLLLPLKPQLFREGGSVDPGGGWARGGYEGYRVRWQEVLANYDRICQPPYNAQLVIVMSDLWGAEGVTLQPTDPYPGDDGDWTYYEQFVTQVVTDVKTHGMDPDRIQYEIWNEPDYSSKYFPRPYEQYEETWRRGVTLIRKLDPQARIEGPTFTGLRTSGNVGRMDQWLDMAVASDTAPDILSWHELGYGQDPVQSGQLARTLLAQRGLDRVKLEINEYMPGSQMNPGYNAWYVSRLQRAIDYAALAIYTPCCTYPLLDGLLTDQNGELQTTSLWWNYERYASITGTLVWVASSQDVDAVAGADPERGRVRVLLGNRVGNGGQLGPVTVTIRNISAAHSYLYHRGRVHLRLERVPYRDVLDATEALVDEVLKDVDIKANGDSVSLDIPWTDPAASYVVTLGRNETRLPPYIIAEVDPTQPVMLPDWPTPVTFVVRNFTDDPVTLTPRVSVSDGYAATYPDSITVPANDDASLVVTVSRAASQSAPGELRLTLGEQSATVTLQPSDDWVRVATMSASSTHVPSSPANLNDGRTDSNLWGGGGANGWNDDTPGVWPDWAMAGWSRPVRLGRVQVYTLDSQTYPAAAWGVRDYDVEVRVNGSWNTVAEVRGNTRGVVESVFAAADADALRIVIYDSNDHTYSRLMEIEAFSS